MKNQVSRYEINRNVKNVLVRHAVDLRELQYSCSAKTVYLYGNLKKDPKGEFTPSKIEAFAKDILKLPYVSSLKFSLDNWKIHYDFGAWEIYRKD